MSKRITIEISEDLYGSIKMYSENPDSEDIKKTINQILETFISERNKRKQDPLFSAIVDSGSNSSNVSEEHDRYLYGY